MQRELNSRLLSLVLGAFFYVGLMSGCRKATPPPPADRYQMGRIGSRLDHGLEGLISALVSNPTFRDPSLSSEAAEQKFVAMMSGVKADLDHDARVFGNSQKHLKLEPFEWTDTVGGQVKWVFGYRLGNGPRKIAFIAHLDTVPPGEGWTRKDPFDAYTEDREVNGRRIELIVGRGALEDIRQNRGQHIA